MNILLPHVHYFSAICILKLLRKYTEIPIRIIGCSPLKIGMANGSMLVDQYYESPPLNVSESYIHFLLSICQKEKIDLIISTDEEELKLLKENENIFKCKMVIPCIENLNIFTDKLIATQNMMELGIPVPQIYTNLCTIDKEKNSKFVFRKRKSTASSGIWFGDLAEKYIENHFEKDIFIQEYIDGIEYTVDIFCDTVGNLKSAIPRKRLDIRNGVTYKCQIDNNTKIISMCKKIYSQYHIPGFSNVQFIEKNGIPYFIELNPRFAGTGIASSIASFNVMKPFIEHFCLQKKLNSFQFYMNSVAWNSIITRFYDESIYINH